VNNLFSVCRSSLFLILFCATRLVCAQDLAGQQHWVGSWAAAQQIPEPGNALPAGTAQDVTLREIVHLSAGGASVRIRLSNAFGTEPLRFSAVHIAHATSSAAPQIDPASDRALSFAHQSEVIVPAGADYLSDPISYPVAPLSDLAISFHLDKLPAQQTGHPGSRATSYYAGGDQVSAADMPAAAKIDHWYQISGVDVLSSVNGSAVVALGDSITDGHGATTNGNDRWTDVLAERLQASPATQSVGVLNAGIGGNHLLTDGLGPNALARFDRDVLAQAGVHWLVVFEGVNDLGGLTRNGEAPQSAHDALVQRILAAYQQLIARAHAAGIEVVGATITPFTGSDYYHPGPQTERDREKINEWIRSPGNFDAVVDFDSILRDPHQPERLLPSFDCGDHLHPSPLGYRALGTAIPLSLFQHAK
jgi:lysophospholipase L1-like esterase